MATGNSNAGVPAFNPGATPGNPAAGVATPVTGTTSGTTAGPTGPAAATPPGTVGPDGPIPGADQTVQQPNPYQVAPLDSTTANAVLPGGANLSGVAASLPRPYDEKQLVQELATELKVKSGGNLEAKVVEALAKKYGVRVPTTTRGTGHRQGELGGLRHDIAAWFDDANNDVDKAWNASNPGPQNKHDVGQLKTRGKGSQGKGSNAGVPDTSKNALNEMFTRVAAKLGIDKTSLGQAGLAGVASKQGLQTGQPGTPATSGGPQTAGEAYTAFIKTGIAYDANGNPTGLTATGKAVAQNLANAGWIDIGQTTSTASSGSGFNPTAVAAAYQQVLTQSVQSNTNFQQVLAAGPQTQADPNATPASETQSFVLGVATEFGVGLTQQQLNQIVNQFEPLISSATGGPSQFQDEIKQEVVKNYDPNNTSNPAGVANQMYVGIQQAAQAYGIPFNPQQAGAMVKQYLSGATVESMYVAKQSAIDAATQMFQQQAMGAYPTIAHQIQNGLTVANIAAPYNSITAQYTGKDPNAIVTDPTDKYSAFMQGGTDPKTGAPTMQTLDEWKKTLMKNQDYGFQNTQGAKNMASQFASAILNEFGRVSTSGSSTPFSGYSNSPGSANT